MNSVNAPISLGQEKIKIIDQGKSHETLARVTLRLLPKPQLVIECELSTTLTNKDRADSITLLNYNTDLRVRAIWWKPQFLERVTKLTFTPILEPFTVVKQEGQRLQSVTFDVLNFPSFIGGQDITEDYTDDHGRSGWRRRGHVNLEADGWRIEITAVPDLKEIVEALKGQGGYAITHKGNLKRSGGETFSIEDAENAMNRLRQFLSFARGVHCAPILPVGFNSDGEPVWKQWGSYAVESWGGTLSWFDTHHAEGLAEVFPGFWKCLNGGDQRANAARIALDWYLRSNRNDGNQAGGLIMSQTALERLADSHGSNGSAAKCIRKLVETYSIPSELPDCLDTLKKVLWAVRENAAANGGKDKILDGPEALVAVRNDLVHPKPYLTDIYSLKEYEAWNLAQWYLELVLLNMCSFKGKYGNRLLEGRWTGQIEPVPWAPTSD